MSESAFGGELGFYRVLSQRLVEARPGRSIEEIGPDTHLWAAGLLDSVGMLDLLVWLEGELGRELPLSGDFLSTFFTMERIYRTYVSPPPPSSA